MQNDYDPVDRALKSLRSDAWTPAHYNTELEEKLMQEFNTTKSHSRFTKTRTLAAVLAFLLVGGVTFAATGGVAKLKSWLVRIEIGRQLVETELDENGEGTLTFETEDGATGTIHIKQTTLPDDSEMTRLKIFSPGESGEEEKVAEIVRKVKNCDAEAPAAAVDLGDAEPLKEWQDAGGNLNKLYILPDEEAEGSRIFLATTPENGETTVLPITNTPFPITGEGIETDVEIGENGMITITIDDGEGEEKVLKFGMMIMSVDVESVELPPCDIKVDTPAGEIKIDVEITSEDEE